MSETNGTLVNRTDVGDIRVIALNRPESRNALNDELREQFRVELVAADRDEAVRAVVVTGEGSAFCAGGDVKGMLERLNSPAGDVAGAGWRRQQRTHELVHTLRNLHKPTVAAVNGAATGLGADLAMSCDFVIASRKARLAMSYVLRGLVPDGGATYYLPRRIGMSMAKDLIYSGRTVLPDEALEIGLVDRVVDADELIDDSVEFAKSMSRSSPLAIALSKSLLNRSFESDVESSFASTSQAQGMAYTSTEHRQAVEAFVNKSNSKDRQ